MVAVFWMTGFIMALYFAYPFFLALFPDPGVSEKMVTQKGESVSLILLSYEGAAYLDQKIRSLLKELSYFDSYELIIIDDFSGDESPEIIQRFKDIPGVKIILKNQQLGIADSMNIGVSVAQFDVVIFCDQRQRICSGSIQRVVAPFKNENVGAVSSCISHTDKASCDSFFRRHENFIKLNESRLGNVMGVYGPLYAIKKECYHPIPASCILDDLFLSLKILKTKQIVLVESCAIIDEEFSELYDYPRTKRYLTGLFQILSDKQTLRGLSSLQFVMLMWHKYLRLFIPVLLALSYLCSLLMIMQGLVFLVVFVGMTIIGVLAVAQMFLKFPSRLINVARVNIYYLFAFFDILFSRPQCACDSKLRYKHSKLSKL